MVELESKKVCQHPETAGLLCHVDISFRFKYFIVKRELCVAFFISTKIFLLKVVSFFYY